MKGIYLSTHKDEELVLVLGPCARWHIEIKELPPKYFVLHPVGTGIMVSDITRPNWLCALRDLRLLYQNKLKDQQKLPMTGKNSSSSKYCDLLLHPFFSILESLVLKQKIGV